MNCKQGDLAIIVKSKVGNEGKIVRCIEYIGKTRWDDVMQETWKIDKFVPVLVGLTGKVIEINEFADSYLRPIRDSNKEDEMLRLIGKPEDSKLTV